MFLAIFYLCMERLVWAAVQGVEGKRWDGEEVVVWVGGRLWIQESQ